MTDIATERSTRDVLLDAANDCFARFGVIETTIDDLVRHTGVPRATLYRHVGNKEQIIIAVTMRHLKRVFRGLTEIGQTHDDLGDALVEAVIFVVDTASKSELIAAQFTPLTGHTRLTELIAETRDLMEEQLTTFVGAFLDHYRPSGQVRPGLGAESATRWLTLIISAMLILPEVVPEAERRALLREMLLPAFLAEVSWPPSSRQISRRRVRP